MRLAFTPALRLLARLRFAHKFALIGLVLVVAVGVVGRAYLQVQHTQIAFSAKERVGIKVIEPAGQLLGDLASARAAAVRHERSTEERIAAVHDSATRVDAAVKADNGALGLDKEWSALSDAIDSTLGNLPAG